MALTTSEEKRIQRIEVELARLALAIDNLAAKKQLHHTHTIITKELEQVRTSLTSLQTQLDAIKS